jgi:hypothetical protein
MEPSNRKAAIPLLGNFGNCGQPKLLSVKLGGDAWTTGLSDVHFSV